ncbi:MAG: tRNA-dihydrouridine synthase [Candidatus Ancillula sp.]|jgi:nifR3 family TIM-barrel protein|nr:tRNA-dihydrouridine synthase [Candidatus Ancillula sp.]
MVRTVKFAGRDFMPWSLSPMAGITNAPFRALCREFAMAGSDSCQKKSQIADLKIEPGMFVNEMVAARALGTHISKARAHMRFDSSESFRSAQLYCKEPEWAYNAAKVIAEENLADHIDLNFGCPVKKVTSGGGGSAIPLKPDLLRGIIKGVVEGVKDGQIDDTLIPVSAKFRIGVDPEHIHYLRTAEIAIEEGCKLLTLHARTTAQFYSGEANWAAIKKLRELAPKDILVYGNGDIWGVDDFRRMQEETGCNGVAIGRGVMGRPWLFQSLATGESYRPNLGEVVEIMLKHCKNLIDFIDNEDPKMKDNLGIRAFRANIGPYLKGFPVGSEKKVQIMKAGTFEQLREELNKLDFSAPYPESVEDKPRGRTKSLRKVVVPYGWLD